MVWGGGLLQRIYIPRASFCLAAIGTGLVNILIATVPLIVLLITDVPIRPSLIALTAADLAVACFSIGIGLMISTIAVYFPDVAEMYQIFLTAWMYLTPIVYPEEILPELPVLLTHLNPMYYLVRLYRIPLITALPHLVGNIACHIDCRHPVSDRLVALFPKVR
jgi:ABC-type polysaccharide/polyol phosphate export permease